jgi:hypothetical protein
MSTLLTVVVNETAFPEEYQEEMRAVVLEGVAAYFQGEQWANRSTA